MLLIYPKRVHATFRSLSGMTFRAVSKEATKLTVSFSKPPVPSVDVRLGSCIPWEIESRKATKNGKTKARKY